MYRWSVILPSGPKYSKMLRQCIIAWDYIRSAVYASPRREKMIGKSFNICRKCLMTSITGKKKENAQNVSKKFYFRILKIR